MRVFIEKPADKVEEQRKAREVIKALSDYGFKFANNAGDDYFDVAFPQNVNRGALQHFLSGIGARAVTVQPGDAVALVQPGLEARGVDALIENKLVATDLIPIEDLSSDVQQWRDSLWVDDAQIDAAQEQKIFDEITAELDPPGFFEQIKSSNYRDSVSRMAEDNEAEMAELVRQGKNRP